jgi:predicted AAA+ superfamily ATPase
LNFRQHEASHLMENAIYNELRLRGYNVDVGIIATRARDADGRQERVTCEIDFVANLGSKRYYVQSAFLMPDDAKREQENRPLRNTGDSFRKIIVTGSGPGVWRNDDGHTIMNIQDFLLNPDSLDL